MDVMAGHLPSRFFHDNSKFPLVIYLCVIYIFVRIFIIDSLTNFRLRHQKTCMNGSLLWNMLFLKHQVQLLLWDTTEFFAVILLIQSMAPFINVCLLILITCFHCMGPLLEVIYVINIFSREGQTTG